MATFGRYCLNIKEVLESSNRRGHFPLPPPGRNRVNVKIDKSILKYFIIIVTTKSVGTGIVLEIGERRCKTDNFALGETFDSL